MKKNNFIVLTLIMFLANVLTAQEKIKYNKDVYPLLKAEKYEEALPVLEKFLISKPTHPNANYWAGKIYEAKAYNEINLDYKFKAFDCYSNCRKNVQTYDLTVVSAARYPDITGLDSDERYASLLAFLDGRMSELNHFKEKIKTDTEYFTYKNQKEFTDKTGIELSDEITSLDLFNLEGRVDKTQLLKVIKYKGTLYIDASSNSKKQKVEVYAKVEDNKIISITEIKYKQQKTIKGEVTNMTLNNVMSLLAVDFTKLIIASPESTLSGTMEYVEFNEVQKVNGGFLLTGDNIAVKGNLLNGNGFVNAMWMNYETYANIGVYLEIKANAIVKFRYESLYSNSTVKFHESESVEKINANLYYELDLTNCPLVEDSNPITTVLKLEGPYNNEDEGADIILDGYNFLTKEGKEIFFSQSEVNDDLKTELNTPSNKEQWYNVTYSTFIPQAKVFTEIEPVKKITALKQTQIFNIDELANKYNDNLSSSDLTKLNSLAKKWLQSVKDGNYEAYKNVVAKPFQWNLDKFTKATPGAKSKTFVSSSEYVKGTINLVDVDFVQGGLKTVYSAGVSSKIAVVMNNNVTSGSTSDGSFYFVKQNGVWKIAYWDKHALNNNKLKELKAINTISKSPPSICDCVNETAAGNEYMAEKCKFYYSTFYNEKSKLISEFVGCLNEENYCTYNEQTQSKGLESFYFLFNEIYGPNKEEQAKMDKLKALCK